MKFLTGMYETKLDDKGRLSMPSRLRSMLSSNTLVVLPGLDSNHLMVMLPDYFENEFCPRILSSPLTVMQKEKRILMRKLIAPAQYLDMDGSGRINIPSRMLAAASLSSRSEALIVGTGYTLELWNPDLFYAEEDGEESVSDLAERLFGGLE